MMLVAGGDRREEGLEGHLLAVHLDADVQVEPVAPALAAPLPLRP